MGRLIAGLVVAMSWALPSGAALAEEGAQGTVAKAVPAEMPAEAGAPDAALAPNFDLVRLSEQVEGPSCAGAAHAVVVTVVGLKKVKGLISANIYGDPDTFLDKGAKLARVRVTVADEAPVLCLPVAHPGQYAIALYHDEDGNRKLSKGFLGIPKEPFGFSNNPRIGMGPPSFDKTAFDVSSAVTELTIDLD